MNIIIFFIESPDMMNDYDVNFLLEERGYT